MEDNAKSLQSFMSDWKSFAASAREKLMEEVGLTESGYAADRLSDLNLTSKQIYSEVFKELYG